MHNMHTCISSACAELACICKMFQVFRILDVGMVLLLITCTIKLSGKILYTTPNNFYAVHYQGPHMIKAADIYFTNCVHNREEAREYGNKS